MKDTNNKFKVNLDMKDILVTEEQRIKFLTLYNKLHDTLSYIHDCNDITLSQISNLEDLKWLMHRALKFSPQKNKDGDGSNWYGDWVLSCDEMAYKDE
mgnify:FL=1|tara:strand:- start:2467 stop:2760 length:294 start_codon:yes stop_codon:yes gene_type:complete